MNPSTKKKNNNKLRIIGSTALRHKNLQKRSQSQRMKPSAGGGLGERSPSAAALGDGLGESVS